ncbi:major facilitator superfamily transporter [Lepidopterella palustris CBS 459.81]|uniref:Major facilitator superfamily transporter n=1 Tax=Lepidopterella palustris CBS 459.81 TaxID=1314670 RepID=A0A8E2DXS7_9PEZI|nr:major facilitator superfamily transporter [Lepidopterella palustris CBS 459.81]
MAVLSNLQNNDNRYYRKEHVSHFRLLTDPAGVTDKVLKYTYIGTGTEVSPYIVDFLNNDPYNPLLLPRWKKYVCTTLVAFATLAVTFISSAYSGAVSGIIDDFGVSEDVAVLGISVFVLGFALGPLLWAPLSEQFGRRLPFFGTYFALTAFNGGCVAANSFATLTVLRFFAGVFGSSSLTNSGAIIADMFDASERGMMLAVFLAAPLLGPSFGPIAGGYLGEAAGWRWVHGLFAIFTGTLWILITLFVPETYAPSLLSKRAAKLSRMTGKVYVARTDLGDKKKLSEQYKTVLYRPWLLLFCEPIVLFTSIYMAIVYGALYMMFPLLPPIFQTQHRWSAQTSELSFLGVAVGMSIGVLHGIYNNKHYVRIAAKHDGFPPPEVRLKTGILASVTLPIGLFWFAWTNGSEIHWIVPIIGTAIFSYGLVVLFLSLTNYLVDTYVIFAASVLAASTVLRSIFGAVFPLFTTPMLHNLGIHWAGSVPAFLALACMPFPLLFYVYGRRIRSKGKYAVQAAEMLQKLRNTRPFTNENVKDCGQDP